MFFGFNYLKGKNVLRNTKSYFVKYPNVNGLTNGNPVTINGFVIGNVKNIRLLDYLKGQILVELELQNEIELRENATASIVENDILGSKSVKIELINGNRILRNKDTLKAGYELSITEEISTRAAPLLAKMDSIFKMFGGSRMEHILTKLDTAIKQFIVVGKNINEMYDLNHYNFQKIVKNVESITTNIDTSQKELNKIVKNISSFSDTLSRLHIGNTLKKTDQALTVLENVLDKINQGKGSLGLLLNDKELYDQLQKSSTDLDKLVIDIKQNPRRYVHFSVFGGGKEKEVKKEDKKELP